MSPGAGTNAPAQRPRGSTRPCAARTPSKLWPRWSSSRTGPSDGRAFVKRSRLLVRVRPRTVRPLSTASIPNVLVRAVQLAIDTGLVDDLDWLGPGPATVALYELTAALPSGRARRELGRRVFARVYEGTAATFALVAARMALGPAERSKRRRCGRASVSCSTCRSARTSIPIRSRSPS